MNDIVKIATEVVKISINAIEVLKYQNSKLNRLIEELNQRSDVTDDTRRFIVKYLDGNKEKLN